MNREETQELARLPVAGDLPNTSCTVPEVRNLLALWSSKKNFECPHPHCHRHSFKKNKKIVGASAMKEHWQIYHMAKGFELSFSCPGKECSKVFKYKRDLQRHLKLRHKLTNELSHKILCRILQEWYRKIHRGITYPPQKKHKKYLTDLSNFEVDTRNCTVDLCPLKMPCTLKTSQKENSGTIKKCIRGSCLQHRNYTNEQSQLKVDTQDSPSISNHLEDSVMNSDVHTEESEMDSNTCNNINESDSDKVSQSNIFTDDEDTEEEFLDSSKVYGTNDSTVLFGHQSPSSFVSSNADMSSSSKTADSPSDASFLTAENRSPNAESTLMKDPSRKRKRPSTDGDASSQCLSDPADKRLESRLVAENSDLRQSNKKLQEELNALKGDDHDTEYVVVLKKSQLKLIRETLECISKSVKVNQNDH